MQKEIELNKANKRSASSAFPDATEPTKKNPYGTDAHSTTQNPRLNEPFPPPVPLLPDKTNNQTTILLPDATENLLPDTTAENNVLPDATKDTTPFNEVT